MSPGWLARLRWRRRGAWMWPVFVVLTIVDAVIAHLLPPTGDSASFAGALVVTLFLNVLAVLFLSRPVGALLRRRRGDLPSFIARDYGGRIAVATVTLLVLVTGLIHRHQITQHQHAKQDAITRAQAFIGARAPAEFRRNVQFVSTFTIEPGHMYRTCVPSDHGDRTYCVIVNTKLPFAQSVRFDGYEPNSVFSQGVG
jgi:hypothetical protein